MAPPRASFRQAFARGAAILTVARAAPFYARYTIRFHLPAEVLIGLFNGVFGLGELVLRKTLGAPGWMVALHTTITAGALLLAMVWRDLLQGRARGKVLVLTGLFGKGALLLMAFATSPVIFLAVVVIFAVVDSAFIPLRNSAFRANYDEKIRGRLFGAVVALASLAYIVSNQAAAWVLDRWDWSYRIIFPVAGAVGLTAHLIYARMRVRGDRPAGEGPRIGLRQLTGTLSRSFRNTVRILKEDPHFRAYERNFFLYGLAFLANLPLFVFLVNDRLVLSYSEASTARYITPPLVMALLSPVVGRLLDRSHPVKLMAGACLLLALHTALLAATWDFWLLLTSFAVFGVAMTAVNLAWNLGPVQFAPTEERAGDYMGVHVTLTGVRALVAPLMAVLVKQVLGLTAGFVVTAGLYLLASALMLLLARRLPPADLREPAASG